MVPRGKRPRDLNSLGKFLVDQATDPSTIAPVKNKAAVELGLLGGQKGGRARADKLSPKKRKAIAVKAAKARWGQHK